MTWMMLKGADKYQVSHYLGMSLEMIEKFIVIIIQISWILSDPQWRKNNGDPDRIRTCDLLLRRQALYPAELRDHDVGEL